MNIRHEMDQTLDQLIENAKAFRQVPRKKLEAHELDALEKTQESLLAHLLRLDESLNQKQAPERALREKAVHFHQLHRKLQTRFRIRRKRKKLQEL